MKNKVQCYDVSFDWVDNLLQDKNRLNNTEHEEFYGICRPKRVIKQILKKNYPNITNLQIIGHVDLENNNKKENNQ